ncbi:hypothetical protein BU15DRAFT_64670 [Melanogaster broomeanus]|nr:hypothetical protein BU15DRAFT_64670 [Melanogaster broomeanus]
MMKRTPITHPYINGLPVELLQLIFRYCLPAGVAYFPELSWMTTTLRLRHVCRTWKDVIQNYPLMWRYLFIDARRPFELNADIINLWFNQVFGNVRLAVLVSPDRPHDRSVERNQRMLVQLVQHLQVASRFFTSTTLLTDFRDRGQNIFYVDKQVSTSLEMPHVVEVGDITLQQSGMRKYSRCKDLGDGSTIEESGSDDFVVDTGDRFPLRWRILPFTWGRLLELSLTLHITKDIMDDSLQNIKHCLRLECLHVDIDLSGDFLWHQGQDDVVHLPHLQRLILRVQIKGDSRGRARACFMDFVGALRCPKLCWLGIHHYEDDYDRRVCNSGSNLQEHAYLDVATLLCRDQVPDPPLCWMALDAQVRLVDFCAVIGFASDLSALSLARPTGEDIWAIIQGVLEKDSLVVSPLPKSLVLRLTVSTAEQFNDISLAVTNAARASNINFLGTGFNPVLSGSQSYLELCFPNETRMVLVGNIPYAEYDFQLCNSKPVPPAEQRQSQLPLPLPWAGPWSRPRTSRLLLSQVSPWRAQQRIHAAGPPENLEDMRRVNAQPWTRDIEGQKGLPATDPRN